MLAGTLLLSQIGEAEAMMNFSVPGGVMGQVFIAVSGCITLLQFYKVQEAAGNGAAALVDEVVGGTSEVFGSILSGINNTVKVSMLIVGICFVSLLTNWMQAITMTWWINRRQEALPDQDRTPDAPESPVRQQGLGPMPSILWSDHAGLPVSQTPLPARETQDGRRSGRPPGHYRSSNSGYAGA